MRLKKASVVAIVFMLGLILGYGLTLNVAPEPKSESNIESVPSWVTQRCLGNFLSGITRYDRKTFLLMESSVSVLDGEEIVYCRFKGYSSWDTPENYIFYVKSDGQTLESLNEE